MADYKPGTMDTRGQEKTFAGFVRFVSYATVVIFLVLIFLALTGT